MIFTSTLPEKSHPGTSLYEITFEHGREFDRDQPCYVDTADHSRSLTFAQVKDLALRFGASLKRNFPNFSKGDVVGIYSPNDIYYMPVAHGVVTVGGIVAAIDHKSDVESAVACIKTVDVKYIVAHPETLDRAIIAAKEVGIPLKSIFVLGEKDIQGTVCVENAFWGNHTEYAVPVKYTVEELETTIAYFYFTSGTTGNKKAVPMTQKNFGSILTGSETWLPVGSAYLSHTELHHISSLILTFHINLMFGCLTCVLKVYTMRSLLQAIQDFKVVGFVTQPWIVSSILKSPIPDEYDLSSLKAILCGGAIVDKNLCLSFYKRFGTALINIWGMTEVVSCFQNDFQGTIAGHMGTLKAGYSCKIVDDNGNSLGYNQRGELLMKGPSLMPGYYNNPALNAEAFDSEGYFHTGDLFEINEKSELYYVDRIKDVIKYKYHYITPQEIEIVVMSHSSVVDCAAVAYFCETEKAWLPRAFAMLTDHSDLDLDSVRKEVLEIVETKLPDEKQLRGGLFLVKDLPRTATGKINRRDLLKYDVSICL